MTTYRIRYKHKEESGFVSDQTKFLELRTRADQTKFLELRTREVAEHTLKLFREAFPDTDYEIVSVDQD